MSTAVRHYRDLFQMAGRRVTIERKVANGTPIVASNVRARITGYTAEEIAGGVNSGDRRVLVLAEDVPAPLRPLRQMDRVIVDGLTLTFVARPDDQTHRDGETLLAYEGQASGS